VEVAINSTGNFIELICMLMISAALFRLKIDGTGIIGCLSTGIVGALERVVLDAPVAVVPTVLLFLFVYYSAVHKFGRLPALGVALAGFAGFVFFQHGVVVPLLGIFHWDVVHGVELYVYLSPLFVYPLCMLIRQIKDLLATI